MTDLNKSRHLARKVKYLRKRVDHLELALKNMSDKFVAANQAVHELSDIVETMRKPATNQNDLISR